MKKQEQKLETSKVKDELKPKLTFLDRLRIEKDELQDKYDKLDIFLNKDDASIKVGYVQYDLLVEQRDIMIKYLDILNKRIEDLDNKQKEKDK